MHRYKYVGAAPVIFHDLTPYGIGIVEPDEIIELPVAFEHESLHPVRAAVRQNGGTKRSKGRTTAPETSGDESTNAEPTGDEHDDKE